jgi:hypothetical protein
MGLFERPNGPISSAANSATQASLDSQANQYSTLPVSQAFTSATEAKVLNPNNSAVALSVALPPDSVNEQSDLVLEVCGYIQTKANGTIALGIYADGSAAVTSGNLLHKTASAVTQNTTTAPFSIRAIMRYDSVSGKLTGECKQSINNTLDPEIAFTNVPTSISNTTNPVATFSLSVTSSGATTTYPTTINIQRFSVG